MKFRLRHLFYLTALIASGISLFGMTLGLIVSTLIGALWGYLFFSLATNRRSKLTVALVMSFVCLGFVCLLPAVTTPRYVSRRMSCSNNMKVIMLAMLNYESAYGSFPPAVINDGDGHPMHSWRVLLLPFLEHQSLYERYRFDEPWDGPNNSILHQEMPMVYRCPESRSVHETTYVAIVDERGFLPPDGFRLLSDFTDRTRKISIVEHQHGAVVWTEPRDVDIEEYKQFCMNWGPGNWPVHGNSNRFTHHYHGQNIAFTDGSVHFQPPGWSTGQLQSLLALDQMSAEEFDSKHPMLSQARFDGRIALACFISLALLPLCFAWKDDQREEHSAGPPTRESDTSRQ